MPRFAANLSMLYPELPFLARFAAAAADGFEGVEYLFPYEHPPEAVAGHRILCSPQLACTPMAQLFWDAGPRRVQADLAALLERRIAAGELAIDDVPRAAAQFFTLVKGEAHALLVFGCGGLGPDEVEAHLRASVDLFLRAYAVHRPNGPR